MRVRAARPRHVWATVGACEGARGRLGAVGYHARAHEEGGWGGAWGWGVEVGDDVRTACGAAGCRAVPHTHVAAWAAAGAPLVTRARRVRVRCQDGATPLCMAALNGHLEVVRFLAEKAPDTVAQPANVRAGPQGTRGAGCACVRAIVCVCVGWLARWTWRRRGS